MIKVEHMGVSPSQAKSKKGNDFCPEESTSGKAHEFGSEYLLSELSENKHHCGHAVTQNESAEIATGASSSGVHEPSCGYAAKNSSPADKSFCPGEIVTGNSQYVQKETSEKKHQRGSEIVQNVLGETCTIVCALPAQPLLPFSKGLSKNAITKSLGSLPEDSSKYTQSDKFTGPKLGSGNICEELGEPSEQQLDSKKLPNGISPPEGASSVIQTSKSSLVEPLRLPLEFSVGDHSIQQPGLHCEDMAKNSVAELHETASKNLLNNSARHRDGKTSKTIKRRYMLRSLTSNDRILCSESQEKPKANESGNILADVGSSERQKREKRGRPKSKVTDEYSRIRAQLRYLLNRINYEQSLITAYSTEGWKGLSLEKLKPEKELQRARSEILRRKLKIRDLFHRIDSLWGEGRLPESLFDSEGQIDSEDIFCAKCGSKDLSANNDIILCDGACDRGFHQYCLQPPLLKEDIPPDDEGWLCPACDCKGDCIELVNESQGTSFSLADGWEKVFPEAAVVAGGLNQDPNFGLPSDDSDDNDYNPDSSETDEKDPGDESSSDESDFTSTSEELEGPANADPYLGLPSDDSEDDDYDPDGPDHENVVKPESSSSDFTSDSEDFGTTLEDNISSQKDESAQSINAFRDSNRQKLKLSGKESLNDELLSIMESAAGQDVASVSKKRSNETLDYKRLHDETYGHVPSSPSNDEDWSDDSAPRKRKKSDAQSASAPANEHASVSRSVSVSDSLKQNPEEAEHNHKRKTGQKKVHIKDTDSSPAELQRGASISGSSGKKGGSSTYRRLGEGVKQRLYISFEENHYPDRATKESLAKELEMTFQQVSKWFENARWSFYHSPSIHETAEKKFSEK